MRLVKYRCPSCGGGIYFDYDTEKKSIFCKYCESQIFIDDEVKRSEHKEIIVDEAAIKKAYYENTIKQKELELEEKKLQRDNQIFKLKLGISLFCGIVAVIFVVLTVVGFKTYNSWLQILSPILALIFGSVFVAIWRKKEPKEIKAKERGNSHNMNIDDTFGARHMFDIDDDDLFGAARVLFDTDESDSFRPSKK